LGISYNQPFDGLNNGALAGQDNFTGSGWIVQDTIKYAGTKAIEGPISSAERTFSGVNNEIHLMEVAMMTTNNNQNFPIVYLGKSWAEHAVVVGFFTDVNLVVSCWEGNGVGGGFWRSTGVLINNNVWYLIKIEMNHSTKKWDCYVNGIKRLFNLGFRYNTSDSLNYLRFFQNSSSLKYIDEFWINTVGGKNLLSQGFNTNLLLSGRLN